MVAAESDATRFLAEIRSWIATNRPAKPVTWSGWMERPEGPAAEWDRTLRDAGLVCPTWPEEYGGRNLSPFEAALLAAELTRSGLPLITRGPAEWIVGPALMACGTAEQKAYFLPRIVQGEDLYCQGFSEPEAGSDLASLRTRGVVEDDHIVVTGQKIWTTGGHAANMVFCLCRTNVDVTKHKGLTFVLIPVRGDNGNDNGITFRPIVDMSGGRHFTETYLDGARAPLFNVIGGVDDGWRVTMTVLGHERGQSAATQHGTESRKFWDAVDLARATGKLNDSVIRQRLARAYSQVEIMRFGALRTLGQLAAGQSPGPASSVNKMFTSQHQRLFGELLVDLRGPHAMVMPDQEPSSYQPDRWQKEFLFSRSTTIAGGTAQIQRNTVGERVLGLPREG